MRTLVSRLSCCALAIGLAGACDPAERPEVGEKRFDGTSATIEQFPWHVSVQRIETEEHECAGSIIRDDWVVTTANCVEGSVEGELRIVAGITNLGQTDALGQLRSVDRIVVHPHFENPRNGGDVALLHLATPLDLSGPRVAAVTLATTAELEAMSPGTLAVAAGWSEPISMAAQSATEPAGETGSTGQSDAGEPEKVHGKALLATSVELVASLEIRNEYSVPLGIDQLGARPTEDDIDTCEGHEGGSLVVESNEGWRLVGVDSLDIGCGLDGEVRPPRVYALPSTLVSWVYEVLDEDTESAPNSCEARCGLRAPTGCRCDALCVEDGTCCSDYADQC